MRPNVAHDVHRAGEGRKREKMQRPSVGFLGAFAVGILMFSASPVNADCWDDIEARDDACWARCDIYVGDRWDACTDRCNERYDHDAMMCEQMENMGKGAATRGADLLGTR